MICHPLLLEVLQAVVQVAAVLATALLLATTATVVSHASTTVQVLVTRVAMRARPLSHS
jgi:hypothetical protein